MKNHNCTFAFFNTIQNFMSERVRVRFAPSPTGPLHIGGVRTALFNYLFAKKHKGDFILRIEDTDQTRYVEGAEEYITEALEWLRIPFDEGPGKEGKTGPYRQSERKSIYKEYADQLLETGHAYYAFDTAEELQEARQAAEAKGETFIYNWHNRMELKNSLNRSASETDALLRQGIPYVIRFKSPEKEILEFHDLIRGTIRVNTEILDDKVLFKSDGMPTYHLANIVDDHLMEISHVIRGEEWVPSLPLHIMLYRAFGWEPPQFAHLPLILKPSGKGKLSKRDGDKMGFPVYPLQWKPASGELYPGYREDGYLPEAVINMLALLGWNPGTEQEIFTLQELIESFDLKRVNKGGARFDPEKTKWFQHQYFQKLDADEVTELLKTEISNRNITTGLDLNQIVGLIKERLTFKNDLWDQTSFFFEDPENFDEKSLKRAVKPNTEELLNHVISLLEKTEDFSSDQISEVIKSWITTEKIGFGNVMMPLRLSLVGEMKGPEVFDIIEVLGKEKTTERIQFFINFFKQ